MRSLLVSIRSDEDMLRRVLVCSWAPSVSEVEDNLYRAENRRFALRYPSSRMAFKTRPHVGQFSALTEW